MKEIETKVHIHCTRINRGREDINFRYPRNLSETFDVKSPESKMGDQVGLSLSLSPPTLPTLSSRISIVPRVRQTFRSRYHLARFYLIRASTTFLVSTAIGGENDPLLPSRNELGSIDRWQYPQILRRRFDRNRRSTSSLSEHEFRREPEETR